MMIYDASTMRMGMYLYLYAAAVYIARAGAVVSLP